MKMRATVSRPNLHRAVAVFLSSVLAAGCATTVPYTGVGPSPQIERGAPVPPIDFLGNVLALPMKLLLWSWKFDCHFISPHTEEKLVEYLEARTLPALSDAKFQLNEYNPGQDLSRLIHNRYVAWPYRLLLGFPTTLVVDVLLPGRLFPWGDYYNPYTNTAHLYSDHPAIALHEAGHAHDFAQKKRKGTYAATRLIPFVDLYQEWQATRETLHYLRDRADHQTEVNAYKILYPAYGSYVGSYIFPPVGTIGGILVGHAAGRSKALLQTRYYERLERSSQNRSTRPEAQSGARTEPITHKEGP